MAEIPPMFALRRPATRSVLSTQYSVRRRGHRPLSPVPGPLSPAPYLLFPLLIALNFPAASAQDDLPSQEESAIRAAVERVAPSVVKIETIGGLERVGKVLISTGPTTGLVVDESGYILSSAFNFVQKPSSILVTLPSGARAAAQIVARDNSRMLVLLKVNTSEKLTPPIAAPKNEMTVGEWAIAVGRTYDQPLPNVSVGVLSATGRIW